MADTVSLVVHRGQRVDVRHLGEKAINLYMVREIEILDPRRNNLKLVLTNPDDTEDLLVLTFEHPEQLAEETE